MRYDRRWWSLGKSHWPVAFRNGDCGAEHAKERFQAVPFEIAGKLGEERFIDVREMRLLGIHDGKHEFCLHDLVRWSVEFFGLLFAPFPQVLEDVQRARAIDARTRDSPRIFFRAVRLFCMLNKGVTLFCKPVHASGILQFFCQNCTKFMKVERIVDGVFAHVQRKRSNSPVGSLVFFFELVSKIFFDQVSKPEVLFSQNLCGKHRVKNALWREPVGLPQESEVVICTMENQRLHCTSLKQRCKVQSTKRINNIMVFANGNLDEAETSRVMVHGIRFGIDSGHVVQFQIGKQICQRFFAIDQYVFLVFHHLKKKCNNIF